MLPITTCLKCDPSADFTSNMKYSTVSQSCLHARHQRLYTGTSTSTWYCVSPTNKFFGISYKYQSSTIDVPGTCTSCVLRIRMLGLFKRIRVNEYTLYGSILLLVKISLCIRTYKYRIALFSLPGIELITYNALRNYIIIKSMKNFSDNCSDKF
jgi:hypothetical protein